MPLGCFDLFNILGWVEAVTISVIFVSAAWFGWRFFRGDIVADDPGGSLGRQIFGRWRKSERPEDWLKK